MKFNVNFKEQDEKLNASFGEVTVIGGGSDRYEEGVADGRTAERSEFWDIYQNNGSRTDYQAAFSGVGWNNQNIKPKYNIIPVIATQLFCLAKFEGDLVEALNKCNVSLSFKNCKYLNQAFQGTKVTRVGVIDTRAASVVTHCFNSESIIPIFSLSSAFSYTSSISSWQYDFRSIFHPYLFTPL